MMRRATPTAPQPQAGPLNSLLTGMSRSDAHALQAVGELVQLNMNDVLHEPAARIRHAYFPSDSIISLMLPVDGGSGLEVGLVGSEGMLGTPLILGVAVSPLCALVQGAGRAWRIPAGRFAAVLARRGSLRRKLHRYLQVRMSQLTQAAACTRFHVVEERLARCLLMIQDRTQRSVLHVTHEVLAEKLGVRRVGVTLAANVLERRQLIRCRRGEITILDRAGMEAMACSCYLTDVATYNGLLAMN
jgi:CRP-like cAMP-binding protein